MSYSPQVWNTVTGNWVGLGGFAGNIYTIEGVARLNGEPVAAVVSLHNYADLEFRAKVIASAVNGYYKFEDNLGLVMKAGETYLVVCDYGDGVRPLVHGRIEPHVEVMAIAYDEHWAKVVLLLHMDGADQSTAFVDVKGKTIAVAGNAKQVTAQKKFGTASAYFDGDGDAIGAGVSLIASEDYTIEGWFFPISYSSSVAWGRYIYSQYDSATDFTNRFLLGFKEDNSNKLYAFRNGDGELLGATTVTLNAWHHFALTRQGTARRLFLDGVLDATGTTSGSLSSSVSRIGGCLYNGEILGGFHGYLDEIRITKGLARYTANFTPPTAAFLEADPGADPYFANVVLLCHMEGANDSAVFTATKGGALTTVGTAKHVTGIKKQGSSSLDLNGTGGCIYTGTSVDFYFPGDFTFEAFVFAKPGSSYRCVFGDWVSARGYPFLLGFDGSGASVTFIGGGNLLTATGTPLPLTTWTHVAWVRSGSVITYYQDGVPLGNVTYANAIGIPGGGRAVIGADDTNPSHKFFGNIDEVRITKGVARYTANFTPPAVVFPDR
jgi:hypothetical protein